MIILKKNNMKLEILKFGAEMKSFKIDDEEFLWNKEEYWAKTSPILFPFVGAIIDGKYKYKGREYNLSTRHGFARDYEFEIVSQTEDSVIMLFEYNKETLEKYPFKFKLYISYKLNENGFNISYKVVNIDDKEMYFSIGSHPAFFLDGDFEKEWQLVFEKEETAQRYKLTEKNNFSGLKPFFENLDLKDRFMIDEKYFIEDAIAFKNINSEYVILRNIQTGKEIKVNFKGFPYIAFWKILKAPFLCIENWYGITDLEERSGNLEDKEGINLLMPKEEFNADLEFVFRKGK